jgi:tetratricopeptide (TPR) repeat protein
LTAGRLSTTGVESALQASLARLAPATRRLLLTLSTLPTAEFPGWIAGPMADRPHEAGRMLDELVQAAMLSQVHDVSGTRFLMHDVVRRFAQDRCAAEVPDADNILRRALDLLAEVAIEAQETLPNNPFPSPITAGNAAPAAVLADPASWFEVERALLLRALGRRPDWRLLAGTVIMVSTSGLDDEWRAAARRLLDDPTVDDLPRAMIQMALAGMLLQRGHDEDPAPLARAARRTFVALGDPLRAAVSALLLAAASRRSYPRVAEAALAWSLARVDGHYAAHALVVRGNMRADEERFDEAVIDYRAALSLLEDDPFPPTEANALVCLANVLRHGDMLDPASHGLIERATAIFRQLGDLVAVCHCHLALARQHLHLGRPEDAERVARQALLLSSDIGHLNAAESTRALIQRMTNA